MSYPTSFDHNENIYSRTSHTVRRHCEFVTRLSCSLFRLAIYSTQCQSLREFLKFCTANSKCVNMKTFTNKEIKLSTWNYSYNSISQRIEFDNFFAFQKSWHLRTLTGRKAGCLLADSQIQNGRHQLVESVFVERAKVGRQTVVPPSLVHGKASTSEFSRGFVSSWCFPGEFCCFDLSTAYWVSSLTVEAITCLTKPQKHFQNVQDVSLILRNELKACNSTKTTSCAREILLYLNM